MRVFAHRVRTILVCGALACAGAVAAVPAGSAAPDPAHSVTVFLQPANPTLLDRLANHPGPLTAARRTALEQALPSEAAKRSVSEALRARGFTITDTNSWSVTAQAPASTLAAQFGGVSLLTGLFTKVPAVLGSLVSGVFPTAGGRPAVKPHALTGGDFRKAYTNPALTRARITPYAGHYKGARPTIATIQFSGWDRGDLAKFAARNHIPYSTSMLTQVPVLQARVPTTSDGDGAIEVALDQEAILATNRYAHQRAYFAPNSDAGFAGAFQQVLNDVTVNKHAHRGGDRHIVALSISWGSCEPAQLQSAAPVNNILKSLVGAGVTVFAATGDDGAFDCTGLLGNPTEGVDFPAASPYVVGVGGTRLTSTNRASNNGRNWSESAWSCDSASDCSGGLLGLVSGRGGSGGGTSQIFGAPPYQRGLGGSGRMLPDIAAVGDPATGMSIYTSQSAGPVLTVGGTSLASPVEAALFTSLLSAHGRSTGIGNVHGSLYSAAKVGGTFRDITSGTNGGYDAGPGYDQVTGLGAPLWPAIGNRIFGVRTIRPKVSWKAPGRANHRKVTVRWKSGKRAYFAMVTIRRSTGSVLATRYVASPKGRFTFRGKVGHKYVATVTVTGTNHRISTPRNFTFRLRR